jgi:mannose-6-phosphate isomerase-like protein (cupin superfamily)
MEIVSRENAEHYSWGNLYDGWHLLKSSGLSIIQELVPAGGSEDKHYHLHSHQFFFVLNGEATMEINDTRILSLQYCSRHLSSLNRFTPQKPLQ